MERALVQMTVRIVGPLMLLTLALGGCSTKAPNNRKQHTGDGLCADAGKDPQGRPKP